MTEPGLDRLRVDAGRDQQARVGVPQVVEADLQQAGEIQVPLKGPVQIVRVSRPAGLGQGYPDFIAVDEDGVHWLFETKGQQTVEVAYKDKAATLWCENATKLLKNTRKYMKVSQKDFETLQPHRSADLVALDVQLLE